VERDPIYDRLLTRDGMASTRKKLVETYEWLIHRTKWDAFDNVKSHGLERKDPGGRRDVHSEYERQLFGGRESDIVCMGPVGRKMPVGRSFCVALNREHFGTVLGLDFSFFDIWKRLPEFAKGLDDAAAFARIVYEAASVAFYEGVPGENLRIWRNGLPTDNPSRWPWLREVAALDDHDEWRDPADWKNA